MKVAVRALEDVADEVGRLEEQEEVLKPVAEPEPNVPPPSGEISVAPLADAKWQQSNSESGHREI